MRLYAKHIILLLMVIIITDNAIAQGTSRSTPEDYILLYKDLAVAEMKRTGIPASITLSQGLLESGNGNSRLAVEGNNHFGIKCKKTWTGPSMKVDDDAPQECFRVYDTPEESYKDHSEFLVKSQKYKELFTLDKSDYKGWAEGLKKAGYATNPNYPRLLVSLIERYSLTYYDDTANISDPEWVINKSALAVNKKGTTGYQNQAKTDSTKKIFASNRETKESVIINQEITYPETFAYNGTEVYVAKPLEDIHIIAVKTGLLPWQLLEYNDLSGAEEIVAGTILYTKPKLKEATIRTHTVSNNESMYYLSQKYNIKLARLYKLNRMEPGNEPSNGEMIFLQEKRVMPPQLRNYTGDVADNQSKKQFLMYLGAGKVGYHDNKTMLADVKKVKSTLGAVVINKPTKPKEEIWDKPYTPNKNARLEVDTMIAMRMDSFMASLDNLMAQNDKENESFINQLNQKAKEVEIENNTPNSNEETTTPPIVEPIKEENKIIEEKKETKIEDSDTFYIGSEPSDKNIGTTAPSVQQTTNKITDGVSTPGPEINQTPAKPDSIEEIKMPVPAKEKSQDGSQ